MSTSYYNESSSGTHGGSLFGQLAFWLGITLAFGANVGSVGGQEVTGLPNSQPRASGQGRQARPLLLSSSASGSNVSRPSQSGSNAARSPAASFSLPLGLSQGQPAAGRPKPLPPVGGGSWPSRLGNVHWGDAKLGGDPRGTINESTTESEVFGASRPEIRAAASRGYRGGISNKPNPRLFSKSPNAVPLVRLGTADGSGRAIKPAQRVRLVQAQEEVADQVIALPMPPVPDNVELSSDEDLVDLVANNAALDGVLRLIADHHGMNLVLGPTVSGPVTVSIHGVRLEEVLNAICGVAGFSWHREGNLLYVTGASTQGIAAHIQGRYVRVYPLSYVAAKDVEGIVSGLLSPIGRASISEADPTDQLRTQETLVVEDTETAHHRISQYLAQFDVQPKQVLVEAHVFQINLDDENRHGVNLGSLVGRVENSRVELSATGFAESGGSDPSVALTVDGTDFDALVELLQTSSDSRTLASPKLAVVNHQEARIQIGERLPFAVTTTTQAATVESVQFLEVGVVLTVRPVITEDGNVLMTVAPKVSGGRIAANGFPEESTSEVESTVLIPDGGGVVIGGLIREEDSEDKADVPFFGKLPVFGGLFRRREKEVVRNELVIALVTHVIHPGVAPRARESDELQLALPHHAAEALSGAAFPLLDQAHAQ